MSTSQHYYYDAEAIKEPTSSDSHARASRARLTAYAPPGQNVHMGVAGVNPKARGNGVGFGHGYDEKSKPRAKQNESFAAAVVGLVETRNVRDVWTMPTEPFAGHHFATFPRELVRRCILAGSRPGDIIFDPFCGSGTVAEVATSLGRRFIGCELNPEYASLYTTHRSQQTGMAI